jgi:hypothetical protein
MSAAGAGEHQGVGVATGPGLAACLLAPRPVVRLGRDAQWSSANWRDA